MKRAAALTAIVVFALAACGGSDQAGIAACKEAINTSNTGIVQWTQDKSTRPEACKKLSDKDFNKAATEWYDEFNKKLQEAQPN
jgi:hypothetical protein